MMLYGSYSAGSGSESPVTKTEQTLTVGLFNESAHELDKSQGSVREIASSAGYYSL
jgi:hypothetical protein